MKIVVLTIFPELFDGFWKHGMIARAVASGKISVQAINIRDFAEGRHRVTDDRPYGGGDGMVMKPEPLAKAVSAAMDIAPNAGRILLTPQGRGFNQNTAHALLALNDLVFVCGRYEGVDERIGTDYIDFEISIGDYVLTGGELAAMVIIDAVTRLIPGVLGGETSADMDSFSDGLLEHAQYTRPAVFDGQWVPEVLLSGHHEKINQWRRESSLIRTFLKRSDLLENAALGKQDLEVLKMWRDRLDRIIEVQHGKQRWP
jgi:tRNA (guanine37-N1)-methyltransferase